MSQAVDPGADFDPLMYEVIVVGCGPAGLAATLFAVRQRMKVAVIGKEIGGQAIHSTHVENYLGFEGIAGEGLVERFEKQLAEQFVEFIRDEIAKIDYGPGCYEFETTQGAFIRARVVIFATGMMPNRLGVPGEQKFTGHGVSYFTDHYGPTAPGKNVLVIGGWHSGLQAVQEVAPVAGQIHVLTQGG